MCRKSDLLSLLLVLFVSFRKSLLPWDKVTKYAIDFRMICREIRLSLKKKAFSGGVSAKVYVAPAGTSVTNMLFRRRISSPNQLFMQEPSTNIPENKDITAVQADIVYKVDIVVIGAGHSGLPAAYYLNKVSKDACLDFVVLDDV